ncbi:MULTISPECIES: hypothetical protein [Phyllobacteriaceae]|jgi:hypothetical protein|uniref:Uncharacterized protein n=1 Tax=Mesorhizobium hungaricum TaxID=1566387 RepID=A0A1C2DD61_9HYPH|nr:MULTISPECIES: hypothetical protein [Mesorhizobium]MBN9235102.1 hypothetical protein [Mesorhizobium sp.]OCX12698.1 hypothetical protein QV13_24175 [Mesorhizobium hungaricum]
MRDIISNLHLVAAIPPAATAPADNTPIVSTILDRMGFESVALAIVAGTLVDADATFAVTLEHGDQANLSDASAVQADMMNGGLVNAGFTFAADNACRKLGYVGAKRYVRATITPANNTGAAPVAALWMLSHMNQAPTANPPA